MTPDGEEPGDDDSVVMDVAIAVLMGAVLVSALILFSSVFLSNAPPAGGNGSLLPVVLGVLLLASLVPLEMYRRRYA